MILCYLHLESFSRYPVSNNSRYVSRKDLVYHRVYKVGDAEVTKSVEQGITATFACFKICSISSMESKL